MRLVVVTGMSGSGKRTAMKMLEDVGYYCIDNLPVQLIEQCVELLSAKNTEFTKIALGIDVRADQPFEQVVDALERIKQTDVRLETLFLESSDSVLLKRYKETRRMHPLSIGGRVEDGINEERKILKRMRKFADYIIDTSNLLTRELREEIDRIFVEDKEYQNLMVNILSFGFKNGIPQDADLVFDVRFLPNPFYVDELKVKTGLDKEVQDYVMSFNESTDFLNMLENMIRFLIPNYIKEGKNQLVIAIGCTGGHHRSVTLAEKLYKDLQTDSNYGITISHRDITK